MLNRDRPVGQRIGDGAFLGAAPGTRLFTKQSPFIGHYFDHASTKRAGPHAHTIVMITSFGWTDRIGQPHGRSGDKLARKAEQGMIGIRHRGPYFAWYARK